MPTQTRDLIFTDDNAYLFSDLCLAFFYSNKGVKDVAEIVLATEITDTLFAYSHEYLDDSGVNDKFRRVLDSDNTTMSLSTQAVEYLRECVMPPNTLWKNKGIIVLNALLKMLT